MTELPCWNDALQGNQPNTIRLTYLSSWSTRKLTPLYPRIKPTIDCNNQCIKYLPLALPIEVKWHPYIWHLPPRYLVSGKKPGGTDINPVRRVRVRIWDHLDLLCSLGSLIMVNGQLSEIHAFMSFYSTSILAQCLSTQFLFFNSINHKQEPTQAGNRHHIDNKDMLARAWNRISKIRYPMIVQSHWFISSIQIGMAAWHVQPIVLRTWARLGP